MNSKIKKILIVFGTRPEAIKMAPLVKEFLRHRDAIDLRICVTGQHKEMLDQVLKIFNIKPDYNLKIMKPGQDLFDITAKIILGMKPVLEDFEPEVVFVHGDTTTTFATSLACFYKKISVAHIEAGLRTGNIYAPWPEEANRKLTSQLTKYHFAPTKLSKENLLKENIPAKNIYVTGNTVIDSLFMVLSSIENSSEMQHRIIGEISEAGYKFSGSKIILITGHRRENFGQGIVDICTAIKEFAIDNPDIDLIYPVHLNPHVKENVTRILREIKNVWLLPPLEYEAFAYLMNKSHIIVTDSGGIQEEAPSLGKPVLVTRETTERPEAVLSGTVILVGTDKEKLKFEMKKLLADGHHYTQMSKAHNPYGNGSASKTIVELFLGSSRDN